MAGLKVLAKTSQKISIGADTFRLKVVAPVLRSIRLYMAIIWLAPNGMGTDQRINYLHTNTIVCLCQINSYVFAKVYFSMKTCIDLLQLKCSNRLMTRCPASSVGRATV